MEGTAGIAAIRTRLADEGDQRQKTAHFREGEQIAQIQHRRAHRLEAVRDPLQIAMPTV